MTQKEKKQYQQINRKCKFCLWLSIIAVISLSLVKMVLANSGSTRGSSLQQLEQQAYQLRQENQRLNTQLAGLTGGLDQLAVEAREAGFIDNPKIKSFVPAPPLAQKLP